MTTYLKKGERKKEEEENEEKEQKKKKDKEDKARRSILLFCSKLDWKTIRDISCSPLYATRLAVPPFAFLSTFFSKTRL